MKRSPIAGLLLLWFASAITPSQAADTRIAPSAAAPSTQAARAPAASSQPAAVSRSAPIEASASLDRAADEPAVQRTVIDNRQTHIEELRVRGRLQKITVVPKGGAPAYEVITDDDPRGLGENINNARGPVGRRVWKVLNF